MNAKSSYVVAACMLAMLAAAVSIFGQDSREVTVSAAPIYRGWSDQDSSITCGLTIQAPSVTSQRRKQVQLILAIDVSHTMQGEPLQNAKKAAQAVVDALSEGDLFGLITYSTYGRVVCPLQPLTKVNRRSVQTAIDCLGDEKDRNLLEALTKADAEFARFKGQDVLGRYVFVLTNGNPDKGVTDTAEILSGARSLAQRQGVGISTFGYKQDAYDFNEDLLMDLAFQNNGRAYFIEEHGDMIKPFMAETQRVCQAAVRRLEIEILPPDNAKVEYVEGAVFANNRLIIGEMAAASTRLVIFDLAGRPAKQKDCVINVYNLDADEYSIHKRRNYLDIPLTTGISQFNPAIAPQILVYELQAFMAGSQKELIANRQDFYTVFRSHLLELERYNGQLNSDYIRQADERFKTFGETVLANAALQDALVIKRIKYDAAKMLYGE
jgi:Mg-chelatase subunit ChlD